MSFQEHAPIKLTLAQQEALYLMITRGPSRARGYHSLAVRRFIRWGWAVATSDTTAEVTDLGRRVYADSTN